jgi:micrococcal nuclease
LIRFLFLFLLACSVQAETLTGYVTEITDGDTIVVLDADHRQHRIRLAGIDAPERHQAFGSRSTENIARLTFNKNVTVVWKKEDRGRPIGKVTVNGVDVSLEQVKAGMAWWYRKYAKEQSPTDRRLYEQAEQQAQAQRLGLWADKDPIPPWDFRHSGAGVDVNQQCPCSSAVLCTGPKGGRYCLTGSGSKKYQ